jgi:hypothetical protein
MALGNVGTIMRRTANRHAVLYYAQWVVRVNHHMDVMLLDEFLEPMASEWPNQNSCEKTDLIELAEVKPGNVCVWCAKQMPSGQFTGCAPSCTELESLYRERLAGGGVDCPEEREAVRRFVKRRVAADWRPDITRWDAKRMTSRKDRAEFSLDQRIAAAQAEDNPRHPSDWDVFSGASYED